MDDAVICIQFMDYTDWKVKMLLNIEDIETALNSDNISTFIKRNLQILYDIYIKK